MAIQKDHSYNAYYFMANNKVDSLRNNMAALECLFQWVRFWSIEST